MEKSPAVPFFSHPYPIIWTRLGIKTVGSAVGNRLFLPFDALKHQYQLPNSHLFRYIQFRHALFGSSNLSVKVNDLESFLRDGDLTKTLSTIYKQLFMNTPKVLLSCRTAWKTDFPQLDGEDWDDIWGPTFSRLVSAQDHLIQSNFLIRIYFYPY